MIIKKNVGELKNWKKNWANYSQTLKKEKKIPGAKKINEIYIKKWLKT